MIEHIEAKESGKRSASRLLDPQSTDAISSSYRRGKQHDVRNRGGARPEQPKAKPKEVCIYCGELGHGKTPQWHTRRTECSAYGQKWQKCGRQNHIDKACMRGRPTKFEETDELYDEQTAAFAELCTVAIDTRTTGYVRSATLTICTMTCAISGRNARLARNRTSTSLSQTSAKITKRWGLTS